mmetsp:Transcript_12742/g.17117  ORF Transcript_12742/g.17117 Transcript_12742/m.17117 type:complete len:327 (-) Transcript_12742:457-1437(-)
MSAVLVLVIYAYFETSVSKPHLEYFAKHGLLPPKAGDHVFVVNGPHGNTIVPTLKAMENVAVLERENTCFDFGGWGIGMVHAAKTFTAFLPKSSTGDNSVQDESTQLSNPDFQSALFSRYEYFVLMNASVKGPYLPIYIKMPWWHIFTQQLGGPHRVGLVGTTINCFHNEQHPSKSTLHLQSMFLVTHSQGVREVLFKSEVLSCKRSIREAIFNGEVLTSISFLAKNFSLQTQELAMQTIVPGFPGVITPSAARGIGDSGLRLMAQCKQLNENSYRKGGDIYFDRKYGGIDISPLEVVFFKERRFKSGDFGHNISDAYSKWAEAAA